MANAGIWLAGGWWSAACPSDAGRNQSFRLREDLLRLLTVVFADHFINELRIRVVGEVAAHLHDVMLRLKQEAAGGVPVVA